MNTRRDPDRLIHAFLMDGPTELADQVYDAVRDGIEHKRQRVAIGPWRAPDVNRYLKIALAVAAVLVVAVVGYRQFGGANLAGPGSSGSPAPAATSAPSDSGSAPPLTETFTSERHGIAISYPNGWVTRPATEPWTTSVPDYIQTSGDVIHDPTRGEGSLWISVASQPLGESTPDAWAAETIALDDGCTATEPITIDGASGLIGAGECTRAVVTTDGRGYFVWLYTGGDDPSLVTYDRAWFEEVVATIQLQPEDAVDVAGGLPEGPHSLLFAAGDAVPMTVTISAPGWFGAPGGGILTKNDSADPPAGAGMIVWDATEGLYVYGDPCQWSTTRPDTPATTVDEVVTAMAAQASRDASAPVEITVAGFAGKAITLHVPDDAVFSECGQGFFGSFDGGAASPDRYHQGAGQIDEMWILDVNGRLVVLDWAYYEGTPAEDVAELQAIVESMTFE